MHIQDIEIFFTPHSRAMFIVPGAVFYNCEFRDALQMSALKRGSSMLTAKSGPMLSLTQFKRWLKSLCLVSWAAAPCV